MIRIGLFEHLTNPRLARALRPAYIKFAVPWIIGVILIVAVSEAEGNSVGSFLSALGAGLIGLSVIYSILLGLTLYCGFEHRITQDIQRRIEAVRVAEAEIADRKAVQKRNV